MELVQRTLRAGNGRIGKILMTHSHETLCNTNVKVLHTILPPVEATQGHPRQHKVAEKFLGGCNFTCF